MMNCLGRNSRLFVAMSRSRPPLPSFWRGCLFALVAAISSGIAYALTPAWFSQTQSLHLILIGLGAGYCCFLASHRQSNTGVASFAVLWLVTTCIASGFSVDSQLLTQLVLVSLLRILLFRSDTLGALADCAIVVACYFAWLVVAAQTGSLTLTVWCVFLLQAAAPTWKPSQPGSTASEDNFARNSERARVLNVRQFETAQRSAHRAVERLNRTL